MTRALLLAACLAAPLALSLTGCARDPLTGPPNLRLGRDECAECGMLVNEDRFSAGALIERRGRREHVVYDDIGCMLDIERTSRLDARVLERWVHDAGTRAWLRAEDARFILADPQIVRTPMGTGIAAYADAADAQRVRDATKARLLDWAALVDARRDFMEAQFGKPAE